MDFPKDLLELEAFAYERMKEIREAATERGIYYSVEVKFSTGTQRCSRGIMWGDA